MATAGKKSDKLLIVSFGSSDKYLLSGDADSVSKRLANLESELNADLKAKYPSDTFAYYTTPRVTEVYPENADRFSGYAPLDTAAVTSIKHVLEREVEEMESTRCLNNDAPYANVNPGAAGVGGLL